MTLEDIQMLEVLLDIQAFSFFLFGISTTLVVIGVWRLVQSSRQLNLAPSE